MKPVPQTVSYGTVVLFSLMAVSTLVGIPTFAYFYDYTAVDWTMLVLLYIITGLGITVGYHRLITHRSFDCPRWVKAVLLIAGGWALENSVLKWGADHIRHHAHCDEEADPYNAQRGFWYSHCGWLFFKDRYPAEKYASRLQQDAVVMWQHRYYVPIVLSGLALPFVVGVLFNGWIAGLGSFLLAGVGRTFLVLTPPFASIPSAIYGEHDRIASRIRVEIAAGCRS